MRRRGLLAAVGVVFGGCLEQREPSGPRNPPASNAPPSSAESSTTESPGLQIVDRSFSERNNGLLRIDATIENTAAESRTGTLVVTASTPERDATETRDLDVEATSTIDVAVEFDLSYKAFINGGSLSLDIEP